MATSRSLLRSPISRTLKTFLTGQPHRPLSTTAAVGQSHHYDHQRNHEFLSPSDYLNSWKTPKDPKEAEAQLARLRREYAKKVKEVRKDYIQEMELQRLEKKRKDEAKKEALRIATEERKAAKAAAKKAQAAERELAQEEFRQTLEKERAQKLEYWRMRENAVQERKGKKNELLRRQSSMWVDEPNLEKRILEAIVNVIPI